MSKIQTIEEKQLAAEVYAQRLAYISVTGKEPDALDTITPSGYLNCWNEAIAAVGDPFTDSGQVLLTKLQQKATFHGQKKLYHKDFPAFFFRVLYVHLEDDTSFSDLPSWQDLKFSQELPCPASGVVNWLEASIGEQMQDVNDSKHFSLLLEHHNGITSALSEACCIWAEASPYLPKTRVCYQENGPGTAIHLRTDGSIHSTEAVETLSAGKFGFSSLIQQKQVSCRLAAEKEIYRKLFFIDPGNWETANYISGITRALRHWTGCSDLLAVKLAEAIREEAGFARTSIIDGENWAPTDGWHYDPIGGNAQVAFDEYKNHELMPLENDIYDIETEEIIHHLYHPDFLPAFLYKLGVEESTHTSHITACWPQGVRWNWFETQELKAGTPARLEYTAHWLGINYQYFTATDWYYMCSLLAPVLDIVIESTESRVDRETNQLFTRKINGKVREKYPTVQRAADYAKFKAATMSPHGQPLLPAPVTPKQLVAPTQDGQYAAVRIENNSIESTLTPTEIAELGYALLKSGKVTASNQAEFIRSLARFLGQGELATAPEKTLGKLLDRNDPTRLLDTLKQGLEEYAQTKAARR